MLQIISAFSYSRTITKDRFSGSAAIEFEEGTDPSMEVSECLSFIRDQVSLKSSAA
jgi:hypothetical protein